MTTTTDTTSPWSRYLADAQRSVSQPHALESYGTLTRLTGLVLEAVGIRVPVGSQCLVQQAGHDPVLAEVVGFSGDRAFLMPAGDIHGLSNGASVVLCISADLPFAQSRFCGAEGLANVVTLSTLRGADFIKNYGVALASGPLAGLTARAVVVLDENDKVLHSELVAEIKNEPDYAAALAALA